MYYAYHENWCVATCKICMQVLHKNHNYVWSFCRQTSIRNIWLNHIFLIHRDLGRFVTSGYIPCLSAKRSKTISNFHSTSNTSVAQQQQHRAIHKSTVRLANFPNNFIICVHITEYNMNGKLYINYCICISVHSSTCRDGSSNSANPLWAQEPDHGKLIMITNTILYQHVVSYCYFYYFHDNSFLPCVHLFSSLQLME